MLTTNELEMLRHTLQINFGEPIIQKLPSGAIRLRLISPKFVGLSDFERFELVNNIIIQHTWSLGSLEIPAYILMIPDEAVNYPIDFPASLPTWSEILLAPEPDEIKPLDESEKKPFIVTFYSFKGGVGRSTCLAIVGSMLASRGRRVVMIDFDLEAPGLTGSINRTSEELAQYGALDYIYQRWLMPSTHQPNLADCVQQVGDPAKPLFLIPAGRYDEQYIHKLADFEVAKYYRRDPNPIRQLIEETKLRFSPDVILIDARTGFDDIGAISLLDLADLGILCFSPTKQNYLGLEWVTKAIAKQQAVQGRPDLRFVLTPLPVTTPQDRTERLEQAEEWISEHWYANPVPVPEEMYTAIDYNPSIAVIEDLFSDLPESITVVFKPIVDWIDLALPDATLISSGESKTSSNILNEFHFQNITADQIKSELIPQIFQRTSDFPIFIKDKICLIRGAKGTGKSLLFRLFVEQPTKARELARDKVDLSDVEFIGVHGRGSLDDWIASSEVFASIEKQMGPDVWRNFWPVYALLRIAKYLPNSRPLIKQKSHLFRQLVAMLDDSGINSEKLAQALSETLTMDHVGLACNDLLKALGQQLEKNGQRVWLFFDELDTGFGHTQTDYGRRRRALEGLLSWWLEYGDQFNNIQMKCLLREDIWQELKFPNKSHFAGKDMSLKWQEDDLWRLVLRQAMDSTTFTNQMISLGVTKSNLEQLDVNRLQNALEVLWGKRMGKGNKAYTHRWVFRRIMDGNKNCFPRSLIVLLSTAVDYEKKSGIPSSLPILKPNALIASMGIVSENRVSQVKEEYPELESALNVLKEQSSPIDKQSLRQLFEPIREGENRTFDELINQMINAGILEKRKTNESESDRYGVAELYLLGLGMRRKGQR